jgi:ribosomal protein S27AE
MRYEITYAEEWNQLCPRCGNPIVLMRPADDPHRELYANCKRCGNLIAGFIHVYCGQISRHVIDLLRK